MNAQQNAIARECLASAEAGSLSFPQILGLLSKAGIEGYAVDYRRATTTYYAITGESLELSGHAPGNPVAPAFDAERVQAAVKEAQAGAPGYTYLGFGEKVTAAGCAGYIVSLPGRRVVYFGRTAETHVEHFPTAS